MAVGGGGELLDVQHREGGVGDGLTEDGLGIGAEGRIQLLLRAVRGDEGELHAHFLHGDGEEVVGPAVDGAAGHHVVAAGGDVEHGIEVGGLPGGGEHGGSAALQLGDLFGDLVAGGVLQAAVEIALSLQVKELAHLLAGVVFKGSGLDDGDLAGLAGARAVAALNAEGFDSFHGGLFSLFVGSLPLSAARGTRILLISRACAAWTRGYFSPAGKVTDRPD